MSFSSRVAVVRAPLAVFLRRLDLRGWIWPVLLAVTVIVASGHSQVAAPAVIGFDKLAHFCVFGLLATLVARQLRRHIWLAVVIVSLFGATDEWHQSMAPGRSVEFLDWLADTTGAVVAVGLYAWWSGYRGVIEWACGGKRHKAVDPVAGALAPDGATS